MVQFNRYVQTGNCLTRLGETQPGRLRDPIIEKAAELMDNADMRWVLPAASHIVRAVSTAFNMASTTLYSLEHLAWREWLLYLHRLWRLVNGPTREVAHSLLQDPPCLKDPFVCPVSQ